VFFCVWKREKYEFRQGSNDFTYFQPKRVKIQHEIRIIAMKNWDKCSPENIKPSINWFKEVHSCNLLFLSYLTAYQTTNLTK